MCMKILKLGPVKITSVNLLIFLALSLFVDFGDFYRAFFFLGVIPGVVWFYKNNGSLELFRQRSALFLFLIIFYLSLSSFFLNPVDFWGALNQFRWAVEILFFSLAIMISAQIWFESPVFHGRFFLVLLLCVGISIIVPYIFIGNFELRMHGVEFLSHPIQGPSILLIFWAVGASLLNLNSSLSEMNVVDRLLLVVSAIIVFLIAVFSRSRGPIIANMVAFSLVLGSTIIWCVGAKRAAIFILCFCVVGSALVFSSDAVSHWLVQLFTDRGLSYRPVIWSSVIDGMNSYWTFGTGSAREFVNTVPGNLAKEKTGLTFSHTHNIFLQTFLVGGIFSILMLLAAIVDVTRKLILTWRDAGSGCFWCGLVGLIFVMVNFTDTATLICSPRADWLLLWFPLFFVISFVQFLGKASRNVPSIPVRFKPE